MSNWRPEGWKKLSQLEKERPFMPEPFNGRLPTKHTYFEAGADAMLGAITEEIEKGLLTEEEIDIEARAKARYSWLEYGKDIAQAQLQKILDQIT